MQQRETATRQTTARKREHTGNCPQCGDALDAQRLGQLARGERVLCRDCAFDAMPCTD